MLEQLLSAVSVAVLGVLSSPGAFIAAVVLELSRSFAVTTPRAGETLGDGAPPIECGSTRRLHLHSLRYSRHKAPDSHQNIPTRIEIRQVARSWILYKRTPITAMGSSGLPAYTQASVP